MWLQPPIPPSSMLECAMLSHLFLPSCPFRKLLPRGPNIELGRGGGGRRQLCTHAPQDREFQTINRFPIYFSQGGLLVNLFAYVKELWHYGPPWAGGGRTALADAAERGNKREGTERKEARQDKRKRARKVGRNSDPPTSKHMTLQEHCKIHATLSYPLCPITGTRLHAHSCLAMSYYAWHRRRSGRGPTWVHKMPTCTSKCTRLPWGTCAHVRHVQQKSSA